MKTFTIIKQSFKAILTNKGRSFLTTLGIIIGIGSVIALMSFGEGVKSNISGRISQLGTTNLMILPGQAAAAMGGTGGGGGVIGSGSGAAAAMGGTGGQAHMGAGGGGSSAGTGSASPLTVEDLKSLQDAKAHPTIKTVSGTINGSALWKDAGGTEQRFTVNGTTPTHFKIQKLAIAKGSLFNEQDIIDKNKVIVLGSEAAKKLFGSKSPIGRTLTISDASYKIIGVLKEKVESGFGNPNVQSFIPYPAAQEAFKAETFGSMTAVAVSDTKVKAAKDDIMKTIMKNHKIDNIKLADFGVTSSADLLSTVSSIMSIMTSLLAGIAAISLLVGGIGIMNIMLVSVTERTREIGLRKAVGAKTRDVLAQFVIEAVLLTVTGGVLGIGFGMLLGKAAASMMGFEPIVTANAVFLAVGVSTAVGLIFGIYPAAKAARLDPIDALRYE